MLRRRLNQAERGVQPMFSFIGLLGAAIIAAVIVLLALRWSNGPDRFPLARTTVPLTAVPFTVDPAGVAPLRPVAAWRLSAPDPRFGGLSALTVDRGRFLALSDSSVLYRFDVPHPGATVDISELPDGPGPPRWKESRDSESLARDVVGRGWWVGFETRNQLWLYDDTFKHALGRVNFGTARWPNNLGIEAMLSRPEGLILVPELAHEVVWVAHLQAVSEPLTGVGSKISDMVRLPDGETIALMRDLGLTGFRVALGALVRTPTGWRVERRVPIDLGHFMNVEGIAAQPRPDGGTRLWLVTDDNFQPPLHTVLVALDVPPGPWKGREEN